MLSILNNIPALQAENALDITTTEANKSLQELSSGSRINSGSDDAAGLAISDGLNANVAALNQSSLNVTDGVGELQTADGALSQITSLLNRAVTIATEASNGTVSGTQLSTINTEFQSILGEINNISTTTNYNGQAIFSQSTGVTDATVGSTNTTYGTATATTNNLSLFTSDGTTGGTKTCRRPRIDDRCGNWRYQPGPAQQCRRQHGADRTDIRSGECLSGSRHTGRYR
jgi:flagellin